MSDIKLDFPSRVVVEGELDADRRMRVRQNGSDTAGIWFHQSGPNADRAFIGMAADEAVGLYGTGIGWGFVMDTTTTGNVGIGAGQKPPSDVRLEVGDRMRVRQAGEGGQTAGIWFRQSKPGKDSAFIGMATDTSVGFWGNHGANWGLVMDTATGNVEVKKGGLTVRGTTILKGTTPDILKGTAVNSEVETPVGTEIVLANDSIRVTVGHSTIDLVEEVRKLRDEVDALQGKGKDKGGVLVHVVPGMFDVKTDLGK